LGNLLASNCFANCAKANQTTMNGLQF